MDEIERSIKSPFWEHIGVEWGCADEKQAVILLEIKPFHMNPVRLLHGGVTATMLDIAMGVVLKAAYPDKDAVTVSLNVHYLAPIREGKIRAEAEILRGGRKTITVQGRVIDQHQNLCAFGVGLFRLV